MNMNVIKRLMGLLALRSRTRKVSIIGNLGLNYIDGRSIISMQLDSLAIWIKTITNPWFGQDVFRTVRMRFYFFFLRFPTKTRKYSFCSA